jgi:imidazolonepropionase-like amidohydrolase
MIRPRRHTSPSRGFRLALTLALLVGNAFPASAQEPVALIHANVVNVRDGTVRENATVLLRDGLIASIEPAGAPVPAGTRIFDLRGRHLIPGLVDAHVHVANSRSLATALESGVTTVRSAGGAMWLDVGLRELVKKGAIIGPDVVAAGYHVRGGLSEDAFLVDPSLPLDLLNAPPTVDALRAVVRANVRHGVDWIKTMGTERAGLAGTDPRKQMFTEEELRAVVEEATAGGVPVMAHAHGAEGALAAVKAGVRSIEHGTYLPEEALQLMARQGTYYVPTIDIVYDLAAVGGDYDNRDLQLRGQHMIPRLRETIARAHALGVKIVTGADTGYGPASMARVSGEILRLIEVGLPPLVALQAATITAAEMLQMEHRIGVVERGFEADIVVVERNPLRDPGTLRDPLLVVSNGRIGLDRLSFAREQGR